MVRKGDVVTRPEGGLGVVVFAEPERYPFAIVQRDVLEIVPGMDTKAFALYPLAVLEVAPGFDRVIACGRDETGFFRLWLSGWREEIELEEYNAELGRVLKKSQVARPEDQVVATAPVLCRCTYRGCNVHRAQMFPHPVCFGQTAVHGGDAPCERFEVWPGWLAQKYGWPRHWYVLR